MVRFRVSTLGWLLAASLFIGAGASTDARAAGEGKPTVGKAGRPSAPPPMAKSAVHLSPEGVHFGMSSSELIDFYNRVLDQDFVPVYKATPVGPKMKEVDAALADQKSAFPRSEVVFGNLPTGIDNTPLKGEYNYKNDETMLSITRQGMTRYFFLQGKSLWKIYDAVPLKKDGELGATYQDAVAALTKRYGVAGRVLAEDAAHGRNATEVDWVDATTHVRAIDRTFENLVGLVFEDRSSAERIAAFKASQKSDEGQIDPTVAAVTRGGPAVDPNSSAADAYTGKAHAGAPGNAPPPKKK
jgi:hypothetical protein